VEKNFLVS